MEERAGDILESPAFCVPVDRQLDELLVSRLADFVGDYLMATDQTEAMIARPSTRPTRAWQSGACSARRGAGGRSEERPGRVGNRT